jgi:hypothetical protein
LLLMRQARREIDEAGELSAVPVGILAAVRSGKA